MNHVISKPYAIEKARSLYEARKNPFANWEHSCNYLFLIDENNYEEKEYNKGLCEEIQMEKIY